MMVEIERDPSKGERDSRVESPFRLILVVTVCSTARAVQAVAVRTSHSSTVRSSHSSTDMVSQEISAAADGFLVNIIISSAL